MESLKEQKYFLVPYCLFIIICSAPLILISKTDIHLTLNSYHNAFFDVFFKYVTYLGDGFAPVIAIIVLLFVKFKHSAFVLTSTLVSAVITQTLKRNVFADYDRPKRFFEGLHELYFIPGVENHSHFSFPSGHTTCAFALYFSLAVLAKKPLSKFLLCLLAISVGYSRVYISQHFLGDIYAGSLIGTLITLLIYSLSKDYNPPQLNASLLKYFKRK